MKNRENVSGLCHFKTLEWVDDGLSLLDQRFLPEEETYFRCDSVEDVIEAIKMMVVRGAPAIGIAACYGVVLSVIKYSNQQSNVFEQSVLSDMACLETSRPTAVNLMWAVDLMRGLFKRSLDDPELKIILLSTAKKIHAEDIENNQKMGEFAADIMGDCEKPFSVITHCNAGALATGGYGTALGAVRSAADRGLIDLVYADETRPWLQGARLTAWELEKDQISVCLNTDSAAAWLMANRNIKWVIVGADRIASNGDVANKIGTYNLAIVAKYHNVKVMVVAPSNTVDMNTLDGEAISIEMRGEEELKVIKGVNIAPKAVPAINPVFDVTPAALIDVIVTELGVVKRPCSDSMKQLFG